MSTNVLFLTRIFFGQVCMQECDMQKELSSLPRLTHGDVNESAVLATKIWWRRRQMAASTVACRLTWVPFLKALKRFACDIFSKPKKRPPFLVFRRILLFWLRRNFVDDILSFFILEFDVNKVNLNMLWECSMRKSERKSIFTDEWRCQKWARRCNGGRRASISLADSQLSYYYFTMGPSTPKRPAAPRPNETAWGWQPHPTAQSISLEGRAMEVCASVCTSYRSARFHTQKHCTHKCSASNAVWLLVSKS